MRIQCPQCGFAREVPDDKLPASASRATCPKCRHKFRFRDPIAEPDAQTLGDETARALTPEPDEPQPETPKPKTPPPPENTEEPAAKDDIWRSLESMDTERPARPKLVPQGAEPANKDGTLTPPPWERLDDFGFLPGLLATIQGAMFSPVSFFSSMAMTDEGPRGFVKPLTFYILLALFQVLTLAMYTSMGFEQLDLIEMLGGYETMGDPTLAPEEAPVAPEAAPQTTLDVISEYLATIFVGPIVFTLVLAVFSSFYHLLFKLLRAADGGYQATFRAMTYGMAPSVLAVVPFVGALAAGLWSLVITVIAFKSLHRTTYWRVLAALFLPAAMVLTAYVLATLFGSGGGGAGPV